LVFASDRSGNFELYELTPATREVKRLTESRAQNGSPQYSPDGQYLLFDSNRDGNYDVYRLNLGTGGLTQLTRGERPAFNGDPSWRP
jgi:Tol biopolymer transport system component